MSLFVRVSLVWTGFFVLAFVNGALREVGIKRVIAEPWAHHLSALTGIILFTVYLWFVWAKTGIRTSKEAAMVGAYWFVLTILAETFIVSRWIAKASWDDIIASYNIAEGNLWPLVLVWCGLLPSLMFAARKT